MATLIETNIFDNTGGATGVGLYNGGGTILMQNKTKIYGNHKDSGVESNFNPTSGSSFYLFPVPDGSWLPSGGCSVARERCPTDQYGDLEEPCGTYASTCAITVDGDNVNGDGGTPVTPTGHSEACKPRTFLQPCDVRG